MHWSSQQISQQLPAFDSVVQGEKSASLCNVWILHKVVQFHGASVACSSTSPCPPSWVRVCSSVASSFTLPTTAEHEPWVTITGSQSSPGSGVPSGDGVW